MFFVFDYDGVVIDSLPAVHGAVDELYRYLGQPPVTRTDAAAWLGPSIGASVTEVRRRFGIGGDRQGELEAFYFDAYVSRPPALTTMFPGMRRVLDEVRASGVPAALATMKARTEMDAMDAPLPGLEFFDVIAAPPNHSGYSKKALVAEAIEGLERAGVDTTEGTLVGDRATDIEAGKTHGLRSIAVTWGAGSGDELLAAAPDVLVTTPHELSEALFL